MKLHKCIIKNRAQCVSKQLMDVIAANVHNEMHHTVRIPVNAVIEPIRWEVVCETNETD